MWPLVIVRFTKFALSLKQRTDNTLMSLLGRGAMETVADKQAWLQ